MDPFQPIPFYVLQIVKSVEDLPSLLHLFHVSPVVFCLYHNCELEIFNAVMQRNVPPNIQALLHTIACIRAGKTASHGLYDFISKIGSYGVHGRGKTNAYRKDQYLSASVLRGVLVLAFHIQHLGCQCTYDMLQRCLALNPSHLVDGDSPEAPRDLNFTFILDCHTHVCSHTSFDSGLPSWMEVQRVYHALWRLQLAYDIQNAATGKDK